MKLILLAVCFFGVIALNFSGTDIKPAAPKTVSHRTTSVLIHPQMDSATVEIQFLDFNGKVTETRHLILEGKEYPKLAIRPLMDAIDAGIR